jgi:glucose-1-phosphate thymidylyltransferase
VANKPVPFFGLEAIRDAASTEVDIATADEQARPRRRFALGLQVAYLPQDASRGLAHIVLITREFLGDAERLRAAVLAWIPDTDLR